MLIEYFKIKVIQHWSPTYNEIFLENKNNYSAADQFFAKSYGKTHCQVTTISIPYFRIRMKAFRQNPIK